MPRADSIALSAVRATIPRLTASSADTKRPVNSRSAATFITIVAQFRTFYICRLTTHNIAILWFARTDFRFTDLIVFSFCLDIRLWCSLSLIEDQTYFIHWSNPVTPDVFQTQRQWWSRWSWCVWCTRTRRSSSDSFCSVCCPSPTHPPSSSPSSRWV